MRIMLVIMLCWWGTAKVMGQIYSGKSNTLEVSTLDEEVTNKTAKPVVKWIYPEEAIESVNEDKLNLKFGISSNTPVIKVTLMINNEVLEVFENFSQVDPGYLFDAWVEKSVQLQMGENDISLIIQNDLGALKHQRKIELTTLPSLGQTYALIFAIDEYESWEDLEGPLRDAERIAQVMETKGYNIEIIRNFTTFDLLTKLEEYVVKEFKQHDQLFIYFAGHGSVDEVSGEGFYVCKNSAVLQNSNSTYIAYSVIESIVNNIPAQHIFLLMDVVKGKGEPITSIFEQLQARESDSTTSSITERMTRIGVFSGTSKYRQGPAYNNGSYLSRAFISYLRKSEQNSRAVPADLLREFLEMEPTPLYMEFGDHSNLTGTEN